MAGKQLVVRQGLTVNVTLMLTPRCQVYRALRAEYEDLEHT